MSEPTHTPEPWSWGGEARSAQTFDREGHVYPPDHTLTGGFQHAGPIATVSTDESGGANGRRIVACVNACAGVENDILGRCNVAALVGRLVGQRNALVAALAPLLCAAEAFGRSQGRPLSEVPPHLSRSVELNAGTLAAIQAAVAKAEGEAE